MNDMQGSAWFVVHREGYAIILFAACVTFLLAVMKPSLGWIALFMTLGLCYFFRNPSRVSPTDSGLVLSPADGLVQSISCAFPPKELGLDPSCEMQKVSIFLSVFDVHVNRVPASGQILKLAYNPGRFINASLDKASEYNERQSVLMQTASGPQIAFVQIAGLIARRIVCDLKESQEVRAGQSFGIIKFGSRVDVYLPKATEILVAPGQRMVGGETIICDFGGAFRGHSFRIQK